MKRYLNSLLCIFLFCLASVYGDTKVNLIWQVDRSTIWETDWIMELLSGIELKTIDDGKYEKCKDHSIIVISSNTSRANQERCNAYFAKLHKLKYDFGIIHLSDEYYKAPTGFYKYAKFVFRNCWHEKFDRKSNITCFALGYKNGFWADGIRELPRAVNRPYTWSFAGQLVDKPTREFMVSHMKAIPNYHIHETFAWADPLSLPVDAYRNLLLDSIFIPCPTGWVNLDTFRLYEALECGCIPIVENQPFDYFGQFYGDHPFITVSSWDQAPQIVNELLSNPDRLEERRLQCSQWWIDYKKNLNQKFLNIIHEKLK